MYSPDSLTIVVCAAACALSDVLTGRIPNSLILCGMSCAIVSRLYRSIYIVLKTVLQGGGGQGVRAAALILADGAGGLVLPFLLLGVLAALKMIGGGDVKLFSVIGLQFGARASLLVLWYALLASAAVSVLLVIRRGSLVRRLRYFFSYLGTVMREERALPYRQPGGDRSGEFCMAVPIWAALVIYLIIRRSGGV